MKKATATHYKLAVDHLHNYKAYRTQYYNYVLKLERLQSMKRATEKQLLNFCPKSHINNFIVNDYLNHDFVRVYKRISVLNIENAVDYLNLIDRHASIIRGLKQTENDIDFYQFKMTTTAKYYNRLLDNTTLYEDFGLTYDIMCHISHIELY